MEAGLMKEIFIN